MGSVITAAVYTNSEGLDVRHARSLAHEVSSIEALEHGELNLARHRYQNQTFLSAGSAADLEQVRTCSASQLYVKLS